jgi:biotin operon repressor
MARRHVPGRRSLRYYRAHFRESILPYGVVCLECGKLRKTLGTHVIAGHEMTLDDYREKWGFNRRTVFRSDDTAAKLRRLALKRNFGAYGSAENLAKARAVRGRRHLTARPEMRLKLSESKRQLYASDWQPRRFRKVDDRALRRMAKEGMDTKRIARKTKLSIDQTRRRLQGLGLLPPHRPRRPINRQRVLVLRREGLWPLEVARRLRIKRQHVLKILWQFRQQGVPVPTPRRLRPIAKRQLTEDAFLAGFRQGGRTQEIARRLGVSRAYVIYKTCSLRRKGLIAPVAHSKEHRKRRRGGHRPHTTRSE